MCSTYASITQNNTVLPDNRQYNDALASRISQLRQVLRELRLALHLERLNLQREIQLTSWTICEGQDWSQEEIGRDYIDNGQPIQCYQFKIREVQSSVECEQPFSYLNTKRWDSVLDLEMSKENLVNSESYDQSVTWISSTSASNYYKQKIFNLETDCYTELNKIRSKFMESLQTFQDTLDLTELCREEKELHIKRCENKFDETNFQTPQENCKRDEKILTYVYKPLVRSKSLIVNNVQNNWSKNIWRGRFSDSNICGLIYRSSQLRQEPTKIFDLTDCISDSTILKRYSSFFEPSDRSTLKATIAL